MRKLTAGLALAAGLATAFLAHAGWEIEEARVAQKQGVELHAKGDLQGALREFDRVVALAPGAALGWYNRGLVRRDLNDCGAAIGDFDRALRLEPHYFNALYQRGNCRQALGEYEDAISDYGRAAALPGRIDARFLAYLGRADAERRLGRLDEAHADYTHVIALRVDTTALRSRAWVNAYRGNWREAYADAAKYVHDTEAKERDNAYAVILGTLALRRADAPAQAQKFLDQSWPRLNATRWSAPVLAYLRSRDEAALLGAAKSAGERTEALAYLGVDLLAPGRSPGEQQRGIATLQRLLREGDVRYFEYDLAYHELRRRGLAGPKDRAPDGLSR